MPTQFPFAVDQGASPPGTSLQASYLNGLAFAQSMLLAGGIPTAGGSLTLTQPATTIIYNDGSATLQVVTKASVSLSFPANQDTYVDLSSSGTYSQVSGTVGFTPPVPLAGNLRLYKATSSGTAVTTITQVATACAVSPTNVTAPDEGSGSNPVVAATDSLQQTIWRIMNKLANVADTAARGVINQIYGSTINYVTPGTLKKAILADGSNAGASVSLPGVLSLSGDKLEAGRGVHVSASKGDGSPVVWLDYGSGEGGRPLVLSRAGTAQLTIDQTGRLLSGGAPAGAVAHSPTGAFSVSGVSLSGTDQAGTVSMTLSSTNVGANAVVDVSFALAYPARPRVVVSLSSLGAGLTGLILGAVAVGAGGFQVYAQWLGPPANLSATAVSVDYVVFG